MNQSKLTNILLACGLILLAAASRLISHPLNFTAIGAIALFGGAVINDKRLAILLPIVAMCVTDMILGFQMYKEVYIGFLMVGGIGIMVSRSGYNFKKMLLGSLAGSVVFFIVTNCIVFYFGTPNDTYTHDIPGQMNSYIMAIPFFKNTLLGDLFFNSILYGAYTLVSARLKPATV